MESLSRLIATIRSICASFSWKSGLALFLVFLVVGGYYAAFSSPAAFTPGTTVRIARGTSVPAIAAELSNAHVIAHPTVLRAILRFSGAGGNVQPGVYLFAVPEDVFFVAYRLVTGAYGLPPVRVTFVEGTTVREAAAKAANALPGINAADFLVAATGQEGYLFPDTYFFQPSEDAESVVAALRANFETKMKPLMSLVSASGHSLSDIVIMASLVEKEGRTSEDRRIIAGILWNRIQLGMPLQVDAVFGYIFDRATYSPSPTDLKVKSPYNTYLHTGLPPGPIANPGLDSLLATLEPTKTSYLYYLTGHDGLMRYATTYVGHQTNLRKYLQ